MAAPTIRDVRVAVETDLLPAIQKLGKAEASRLCWPSRTLELARQGIRERCCRIMLMISDCCVSYGYDDDLPPVFVELRDEIGDFLASLSDPDLHYAPALLAEEHLRLQLLSIMTTGETAAPSNRIRRYLP
jgi:hypothetical protein